MNIRVGIVGASISGISAAIELQKLGIDVTVFEKLFRVSYMSGAGIMMPLTLIEMLKTRDLLGNSFQCFLMNKFTTFINDNHNQKKITATDYHDAVTVHWANLHLSLEEKFNKSSCLYGHAVSDFTDYGTYVELTANDKKYKFDYVLFADGYNSLGRAKLYPDLKLEVTNYIAWRGLVNIKQLDSLELLGYSYNKEYYRYLYDKGHLLMFPIPTNNSNVSNDYIINWVLYENLASQTNDNIFELTRRNIAPGTMPAFYKTYLNNLAEKYLPKFPCGLIQATNSPFTQSIADVQLPHYAIGRVCLLGDAATLLRPHVGSNATKGLQDSLALGEHLRKELSKPNHDLSKALQKWDASQCQKAAHLFPLSRALGNLLVTNLPDLKTLSKEHMDELWESTIKQYNWYGNKDSNPT